MNAFDLAALFLALVAGAGWINSRWLRLPPSVAMLGVGVGGALILSALRRFTGSAPVADALIRLISQVDFPRTVVGYMLAFLLFAGSMQVDLAELRRRFAEVLTLASVGVVASTLIVGVGVWAVARALGFPLPIGWAVVFGALISPTDPVAVLAAVRTGALSPALQATLQGEALFNDGVGIVVFLTALGFALGGHAIQPAAAVLEALLQALGGLALGVGGGLVVVRAMRAIDDYAVEVSLSLALALSAYAGGEALHLSGAIAAVGAGLMVGDSGVRTAMSDRTRRYVVGFWTLVDEILNALIFLLLGLEMAVAPPAGRLVGLCLAGPPLVLLARFITVAPLGLLRRLGPNDHPERRGESLILAWGGLRGALSLALALGTPAGPARTAILSLTYAVAVFAVVVQGLSFEPLVLAISRRNARRLRAAVA